MFVNDLPPRCLFGLPSSCLTTWPAQIGQVKRSLLANFHIDRERRLAISIGLWASKWFHWTSSIVLLYFLMSAVFLVLERQRQQKSRSTSAGGTLRAALRVFEAGKKAKWIYGVTITCSEFFIILLCVDSSFLRVVGPKWAHPVRLVLPFSALRVNNPAESTLYWLRTATQA